MILICAGRSIRPGLSCSIGYSCWG
jgi:hypothetical protein